MKHSSVQTQQCHFSAIDFLKNLLTFSSRLLVAGPLLALGRQEEGSLGAHARRPRSGIAISLLFSDVAKHVKVKRVNKE